MPERRRVLGARHRDVHDPRRHVHPPLRLLQRPDGQADLERPARARPRRPLDRPDGPAPRGHHLGRPRRPARLRRRHLGRRRSARSAARRPTARSRCSRPTSAARRCRWPRSSPSAPTSSTTTSRSCRGCTRSPAAGRRWERSLRVLQNAKHLGGDEVDDEVRPDGRAGRDARRGRRRVRAPARPRRAGHHHRPVPAPDRAPPAGRALLAPGRVQGARGGGLRRSASTTSPRARSSARATTPTSTSPSPARASGRWPPRPPSRVR